MRPFCLVVLLAGAFAAPSFAQSGYYPGIPSVTANLSTVNLSSLGSVSLYNDSTNPGVTSILKPTFLGYVTGGGNPPDTQGAVGIDQIVVVINQKILVEDRSGKILKAVDLN